MLLKELRRLLDAVEVLGGDSCTWYDSTTRMTLPLVKEKWLKFKEPVGCEPQFRAQTRGRKECHIHHLA